MKNVAILGCALVLLAGSSGCGKHKVVVESSSMEPTIARQERVAVNTRAYRNEDPQRFDVVLYSPANRLNGVWLHRVIGMPGETISFSNDVVCIDGKPLEFPSALRAIRFLPTALSYPSWESVVFPYKIPRHSYFVLGDNAAIAQDSRFNGAVSRDAVLGRVERK